MMEHRFEISGCTQQWVHSEEETIDCFRAFRDYCRAKGEEPNSFILGVVGETPRERKVS
jgi:hypothetical protein